MNRENLKRWSKISLRTIHLLSIVGVGGGVWFSIEKSLWVNYWWLALISGVLMMLIDIISNPVWLVQVRGLVIYLKLGLLTLLGIYPQWDSYLMSFIVIISAVISHAPGKLRYFSVFHRKTISSNRDSKG